MTDHVKETVKKGSDLVKLKSQDHVLDIASNDATLLNFYDKRVITVGVDPLANKYKKHYKNLLSICFICIYLRIHEFFQLSDYLYFGNLVTKK